MTDSAHLVFGDTAGDRRDTGALLGSLIARLNTLQVITGGQALGSIVAGFAQLGRDAARTAEGARVREALLATRVAGNGEALWARLGMDAAWSAFSPTPVLEDVRNDLALLLADDLSARLADIEAIDPAERIGPLRAPEPIECIDVIVGMWASSREIVAAVDLISAHGAAAEVRPPSTNDPTGPVLR